MQQKTLLYDIAHDVYIARDLPLVEADIKAARAENAGMHHGEVTRLDTDEMETVVESQEATKALEKATFDDLDLRSRRSRARGRSG